MQTVTETLEAGKWKTVPAEGLFFMLLEAAAPVDLIFIGMGSGTGQPCEAVTAGFKVKHASMMTSVRVRSAVATVIKYAYSMGDGGYDRSEIITQQASITDNLAPVEPDTAAAELVLSGDATRRRVILTAHRDNTGAIALGGPALTAANAARWLEAGESYIETDAAPAAVYALAEVAGDALCIEVA